MYKVRKIKFINHPVLKDLEFDFTGSDGKSVDTVILAGENGCGKSTLINELYKVVAGQMPPSNRTEYEVDGKIYTVEIIRTSNNSYQTECFGSDGKRTTDSLPAFMAIFSDVDINFHSKSISSVTSMTLDEQARCKRSDDNLPTMINQLLVDIQTLDDSQISKVMRENPMRSYSELNIDERMSRFKKAFGRMFDQLEYCGIDNQNGKKVILFKKNEEIISVDALSSGEKQIVYRGCFLLRDVNALNGAFVFIDEPEISLHPLWQMKIMEYYRSIFSDESDVQTSQMFVVTHSPFVIHNDNRKNDKVIVLSRDMDGKIVVKDQAEFYKCSSIDIVREAFNISFYNEGKQMVYLEGRTDEKYFNKAAEVFGFELPFSFKWVGYIDENGQEENTGKDSLNKAYKFLVGRNLPEINVCLFDCDTGRKESNKNNVYIRTMPTFSNVKNMKKGIENALVLDEIDVEPFYTKHKKSGDYGDTNIIMEFEKMNFCNYICSLPQDILEKVFANLKEEINSLLLIFN